MTSTGIDSYRRLSEDISKVCGILYHGKIMTVSCDDALSWIATIPAREDGEFHSSSVMPFVKRNDTLRPHAQALAERLQASPDKTARWVGRHRYKEFSS